MKVALMKHRRSSFSDRPPVYTNQATRNECSAIRTHAAPTTTGVSNTTTTDRNSCCGCDDATESTFNQSLLPLHVGDDETRYQPRFDKFLKSFVFAVSKKVRRLFFIRQKYFLRFWILQLLVMTSLVHPYQHPTVCYAFEAVPYHQHFTSTLHHSKKQIYRTRHPNYQHVMSYRQDLRRYSATLKASRQSDNMDDQSIRNDVASNIEHHDTKDTIDENSEPRNLLSSPSIWERLAYGCIVRQYSIPTMDSTNIENDIQRFVSTIATPEQLHDYSQYISVLRVMIPSIGYATIAKLVYPSMAMWIVSVLHGDAGIFAVVSQDASQYIQNICTTSGLVFSILIGQTYYFMYQQQEKIYYAFYDEVAMAKMVLEQISLISRGRTQLYETILQQMNRYVQDDLQQMNDIDPATMLSSRPCDDPLEDILYLTSVGEPSQIYQSIRSLRHARAQRLGSLQMKLPEIQMTLLWILAAIVLLVFPLLGAGSQTIGGTAILHVQSWYLSFLVFGISLVMGIIYELRSPNQPGAYNARTVLSIMISGLQEELQQRLQYSTLSSSSSYSPSLSDNNPTVDAVANDAVTANFAYFDAGPSIDGDGSF